MAVRRRNSALEILELFRRALPQPTVTDLTVLFYVAENPGINIAELADVARTTLATASRVARAFAAPEAEGALPPRAIAPAETPAPEESAAPAEPRLPL